MNGEPSVLSAPRDHTGDALFAAYKAAETTHQWARDNVRDAERGLVIAKLAEQRAHADARAAAEALRAHNAGLYDQAEWLIHGRTDPSHV
jgi:hypothetical protein